VAAARRPSYAAASAQASEQALQAFADGPRGASKTPDYRGYLAAGLGERHVVLRRPARYPARDLHNQRH
jgi:hypothetical protein